MARKHAIDEDNVQEDSVNVEGKSPSGADLDQSGQDGGSQTGSDDVEQATPEPDDGRPMPTEEELDAIDELESKSSNLSDDLTIDSHRRVLRLAAAYPSTTPDGHTIGGYAGQALTVGDLRRIAVTIKQLHRGEV